MGEGPKPYGNTNMIKYDPDKKSESERMLQYCCTSEITKGARHKGKVPAVGRQQE